MPESVTLNEIFARTNINEVDKKRYDSAFSELLRHINHGHVFFNYNKEGCWYISYILHKEVEEILGQYYNSYAYDLLKQFVFKFNENRSIRSDICKKDYVYINSDTYKIMNGLYNLYDEYTKYKPIHDNTIPKNCCFLYENIKHFDTEIRKTILKYKIYECREYPYEVGKLNLYTPPEPEKTIAPVPVEQQQAPNVLQNSHHEVTHHPVTAVDKVRKVEAEQEQGTAHDQEIARDYVNSPEHGRVFKPEGVHNAERSREHGISHGYRSTYNHRGEEKTFRPGLSPYPQAFATHDSSVKQELTDVSSFSQKSEPQKEDEGFMANMRNTITGVLGEVDPVPVVGVSGGMGALFLLFRYTPVGAFFRGGRGRVHRIPRSFNGPFPGGFPGFEEYESGYIGYGPMNPLAE
ncbi:variable surface protein Vir6, putative [Plasmodium vivax]|uniref:Variable surface protein Vir6, putative n=1 Tax=Plasmodium vivax (strain Salvador I) TaxID=126793 RepID=A5KDA0_PLAVS|nr:variable surface protein Vir6, putative [Plasmodium vivax]EDL42669.1 variable surface protein Vir6, putative [Plasmodium vivax]|eukprot:XP_001612462.1 variable surface protein Vir6 [Plasmodium vivax Sal-1]